jgi:hypothetical protein
MIARHQNHLERRRIQVKECAQRAMTIFRHISVTHHCSVEEKQVLPTSVCKIFSNVGGKLDDRLIQDRQVIVYH